MRIRNRRIPLESTPEHSEKGASVIVSVDWLEPQQGNRTGLLVRLRDPEAQKQIGRELQTADRLAAISRISGGVAHEVKNPLNAILLHVEVARTRLAHGEADVTPQMEVISREILRLDRVVKTFLDFTRPVELNYRVMPLRDVVREIEDLTRPQVEAAKVRMTVEPDAEGVDIQKDIATRSSWRVLQSWWSTPIQLDAQRRRVGACRAPPPATPPRSGFPTPARAFLLNYVRRFFGCISPPRKEAAASGSR